MDKTETNDLLEECMLYFKARPVYKKLFLKMRDAYVAEQRREKSIRRIFSKGLYK